MNATVIRLQNALLEDCKSLHATWEINHISCATYWTEHILMQSGF